MEIFIRPFPNFAIDFENTYHKVMWTMRITAPGGMPVVKPGEEIFHSCIGI